MKPRTYKRKKTPWTGRKPDARFYRTLCGADTAGKRYLALCRDDYRPKGFAVLTKQEGEELRHYPVLIVRDPAQRRLHARSGFRTI